MTDKFGPKLPMCTCGHLVTIHRAGSRPGPMWRNPCQRCQCSDFRDRDKR